MQSEFRLSEAFLAVGVASSLLIALFLYRFNAFDFFGSNIASNFCATFIFNESVCNTIAGIPPAIFSVSLLIFIFLLMGNQRQQVTQGRFINDLDSFFFISAALIVCGTILIVYPFFSVAYGKNLAKTTYQTFWLLGGLILISTIFVNSIKNGGIACKLKLRHWCAVLCFPVIPELNDYFAKTLWLDTTLKEWTIQAVLFFLAILDEPSFFYPPVTLGLQAFSVKIGFPCAGLSGIVFSIGIVVAFGLFNQQHLYMQRILLLVPIAGLLSWVFNALRITILLIIGEYYSPTLAVDGFHGYAGWVSITFVTVIILWIATKNQWFSRERLSEHSKEHFFTNANVASILPFGVLMFTLLIFGAITEVPERYYPLRISLVAGCLLLFHRCVPPSLSKYSIDVFGTFFAVLISVFWLSFNDNNETLTLQALFPDLGHFYVFLWVCFRLFGTIIVIPIVEELFFRRYLYGKISEELRLGKSAGAIISSAAFAALHSNFALAFFAGVIFTIVYVRRRNILDAIMCHAICNFVIGVWAITTNDLSVI